VRHRRRVRNQTSTAPNSQLKFKVVTLSKTFCIFQAVSFAIRRNPFTGGSETQIARAIEPDNKLVRLSRCLFRPKTRRCHDRFAAVPLHSDGERFVPRKGQSRSDAAKESRRRRSKAHSTQLRADATKTADAVR